MLKSVYLSQTKRLGIKLVKVAFVSALVTVLCLLVVRLSDDNQIFETKKDWNNNILIYEELEKDGLGEHGIPITTVPKEHTLYLKELNQFGMNGYISERISVNRSIPDVREESCKTRTYLRQLPNASIIIPFFDENWSTLLRTCHSIINRSPSDLIHEIILVDDFSILEALRESLQKYLTEFLPKVKLIRLTKRSGQIVARLTGAKAATGEVLIFLDSHIEVNYNWLPPLLEPIVLNPKTATCPSADLINFNTFGYKIVPGYRGGLDNTFKFQKHLRLKEDEIDTTKPYENPILFNNMFAITRDLFWELGGFNEALNTGNGMRFDISFKIWMCNGRILNVPCSRLGHVRRGVVRDVDLPEVTIARLEKLDYKILSDIWLGEYKPFIYQNDPELFKTIDRKYELEQKSLLKKLQCNSFDWFLKEVAFESFEAFSPYNRLAIASGSVQNVDNPKLCIGYDASDPHVKLVACSNDTVNPDAQQSWILNGYDQLRTFPYDGCLWSSYGLRHLILTSCGSQPAENLKWHYHPRTKWLIHVNSGLCIDSALKTGDVRLRTCLKNKNTLKWTFGYENKTAIGPFRQHNESKKTEVVKIS